MNIETDIDSSGIFEDNFSSKSEQSFCNYVELCSLGFNCLYKAQRYGKWYFLKGLKSEYASQSQFQDLLRKEFDLTVQLDHPNIVRTISFENDSFVGWCIVLEYIDGQTLAEYSTAKEFKTNNKKIIAEILQALNYIHAKQIIHRDLKPENILVTTNGANVKIIDFGLADADYYTNLKLPSGTRKYIAPEQLSDPKSIDNRADIYSFGKIILGLSLPHYYKRIAKKCANEDREKRYKNTLEIETAITATKRRRMLIPIIVLCLLIISVLYLRSTHSNETLTNQPADTIANVEQPNDTIRIIPQKIDTIYVEVKPEPLAKPKSKPAKATASKPQFDLQKVQKQVDDLYKPLLDSFALHQYQWQEDALKSYAKVSSDLIPKIWLPLKESSVFATEREEYDAWQKLVPHLNEVNQQVADYLKELPLYQETQRALEQPIDD